MQNYPLTTTIRRNPRVSTPFPGPSADIHLDSLVLSLLEDQKKTDRKYLFDHSGVRLYQEICLLPEFYQDRKETEIMKKIVLPALPGFRSAEIVGIGTGGNLKIKNLIKFLVENSCRNIRYIPLDFSSASMRMASGYVTDLFPGMEVSPLHDDYTSGIHLKTTGIPRIFIIPGEAFGGLEESQQERLVRSVRSQMQKGDFFITGFDLRKEKQIHLRTYNDQKGLSAAFYGNILLLLNQLAGAGINTDNYQYRVTYNENSSRVEMHLTAKSDMNLHLRKAGLILGICRGESIRSAVARKFDLADIEKLAASHGFTIRQIATDKDHWYSVAVLTL